MSLNLWREHQIRGIVIVFLLTKPIFVFFFSFDLCTFFLSCLVNFYQKKKIVFLPIVKAKYLLGKLYFNWCELPRNSDVSRWTFLCASDVDSAKYVHILFIKIIYCLICPGVNYQQANYGYSWFLFFCF